ncbi:restriction endonuclease subunit S [Lactobacillus amylovorus]|uniref:restriction endonuclease subunit S n=1 Tax=Lactobacillus amylovorus TaxID=1604 RepID=UPI003F8F503F
MISFKFGIALLLFTFFVWEQRKFENLVSRLSKTSNNESLPNVTYDDIKSKENSLNKDITELTHGKKGIHFNKDDILFGKLRPYLGNILLARFNGIAVGDFWVLSPKDNNISSFLFDLIQTSKFKYISNLSSGSKMPRSDWNLVSKASFWVPIQQEQNKIGKIFQLIDNLVSLQQRKVKMLVLLKKEISNYYFSPSYLSRSCKENSFKEIFTVVTDYVANGSFKSLRENVKTNTKQGYAYMIRLQDASNNWKGPWLYTDKSGYNFLKKSKIYPGDIVMSNVGSVGKIIRIPKLSKPMTLAPNAILLRSTKYDNDFLYELLKSDYGKNKIKRMTTPGVQNKINKTDFKKIKVHLPNSQEQKRISCLLTNMNILIHEVKSNISQKQKLKQFLLQNMFI